MEDKSLRARLNSLIRIFNNGKFPVGAMILGFGNTKFGKIDEGLGAIKELALIIKQPIEIIKKVEKDDNGKKKEMIIIKIIKLEEIE